MAHDYWGRHGEVTVDVRFDYNCAKLIQTYQEAENQPQGQAVSGAPCIPQCLLEGEHHTQNPSDLSRGESGDSVRCPVQSSRVHSQILPEVHHQNGDGRKAAFTWPL